MTRWPLVALGALASAERDSFVDGPFGSSLKASEYVETGIPILRLQNIKPNRFLDKQIKYITEAKAKQLERHSYRPGDVAIAKLGDPCGMACVLPLEAGEGRIVADVVRFRGAPDKIDHRFLCYYINSSLGQTEIAKDAKGATRQRVNLGNFKNLAVPLPPVPEQRRIAAILDQADALRARRREALAQLDSLTQSIFIEMFGDPILNPTKWPRKALAEIGKVITGNTPPRERADYFGNHIEWIKSDNINSPSYYLTRATEGLSESGKRVGRTAPPLSILVTCIAGSPECIGNSAMADREVAFNQQINAFVPEFVDPHFAYVQMIVGKRLIQEASTNGMKGMVSKSRFEKIQLMVPPPALQRAFATRIQSVESLKATHRAALSASDALFASLQHRAFAGQLS